MPIKLVTDRTDWSSLNLTLCGNITEIAAWGADAGAIAAGSHIGQGGAPEMWWSLAGVRDQARGGGGGGGVRLGGTQEGNEGHTNRFSTVGNGTAGGGTSPKALELTVISDKIFEQAYLLGSYGIIGIYATVVLTLGSLVRVAFQTQPYSVMFDEMKQPDELLALCNGIYTLRTERYQGHRRDEVRLYRTLVNLLRSPELILKITKLRLELPFQHGGEREYGA